MQRKISPYYAGLKVGQEIFLENMRKYGANAVDRLERTKKTCACYASDIRLTKTKTGITLTPSKRAFYEGMYDFLARPGQHYNSDWS